MSKKQECTRIYKKKKILRVRFEGKEWKRMDKTCFETFSICGPTMQEDKYSIYKQVT